MSKWVVDIHGDIEGDYEIIEEYKEPKKTEYSIERAIAIEDKIEELSERVDAIEKQLKEEREERLNKLKAQLDLAKFNMSCPTL